MKTSLRTKRMRAAYLLVLFQVILLLAATIGTARGALQGSPREAGLGVADAVCIFFSIAMFIGVLHGNRSDREGTLLLTLLVLNSMYLFSDWLFYAVDGDPAQRFWNNASNVVFLFCPIAMMLAYWHVLDGFGVKTGRGDRVLERLFHGIVLAGGIDTIVNLFTWHLYQITPGEGRYIQGKLYILTLVIPLLLLLLCIVRILGSDANPRDKIGFIAYPLFPCLSVAVQVARPSVSVTSVASTCALAFLFTDLYIRKELRMSELNRVLAESRLQTLQMQIKPHFLYNTLASVASLCDSDPGRAQEMIYSLSDYLRFNFSDISRPAVIPFREEKEQLERYFQIEKVRFSTIRLRFDLKCTDFSLPGMTLQPLVENAIHHGVRLRRRDPVNITVSTDETEKMWIVTVSDDGGGMAPSDRSGKGWGVGIQNARTRLELLCRGTLEVRDDPGRGVTCVITLPKGRRGTEGKEKSAT